MRDCHAAILVTLKKIMPSLASSISQLQSGHTRVFDNTHPATLLGSSTPRTMASLSPFSHLLPTNDILKVHHHRRAIELGALLDLQMYRVLGVVVLHVVDAGELCEDGDLVPTLDYTSVIGGYCKEDK